MSVNWQLPKLRQGPGLHLIWCKFALSVPDFRLSGANGSCSRHTPQHTLNLQHDVAHCLRQKLLILASLRLKMDVSHSVEFLSSPIFVV